MASVANIDSDAPGQTPRRRGVARSRFHLIMALVATAVLAIGFGYEVPDYVIHPKVPRPAIMWLHGLAMIAWMALYVTQTALVGAGNVRLHRRLGLLGMALLVVIVPLTFAVGWVMVPFDVVNFPGPSRAADIAFLAVQLWDPLQFAVLAGVGLALRRRSETHRRLMFLAIMGLTSAGLARFPVPWGPAGNQLGLDFAWPVIDALIAYACWRDWRRAGGVHIVFRRAWPAMIAGQLTTLYLIDVHPGWWVATASWLLGIH